MGALGSLGEHARVASCSIRQLQNCRTSSLWPGENTRGGFPVAGQGEGYLHPPGGHHSEHESPGKAPWAHGLMDGGQIPSASPTHGVCAGSRLSCGLGHSVGMGVGQPTALPPPPQSLGFPSPLSAAGRGCSQGWGWAGGAGEQRKNCTAQHCRGTRRCGAAPTPQLHRGTLPANGSQHNRITIN